MDKEYYIHAVTLDGKSNTKGIKLPNLTRSQGAGSAPLGTSLDGRYIAYSSAPVNTAQFSIIDLASSTSDDQAVYYFADTHLVGSYGKVFWSPDGQHLAAYAADALYVAGLKDTDFQFIPRSNDLFLLGWLDDTHVIGQLFKTTRAYVSVDIASGQQQTLYSFPNAAVGEGFTSVSPDGKYALFYNDAKLPDATQPSRVALIDFTKGTYTPLPQLLKQNLAYFNTVAWKPNSLTVAVGRGDPNNHDVKSYLLDLSQDTATSLLDNQLPQRWTPDGTTLVVSDGGDWQVDRGPYTISAVQFGADGTPQVTALTHDAYSFPFPGFVKSA